MLGGVNIELKDAVKLLLQPAPRALNQASIAGSISRFSSGSAACVKADV
jgi:hypothetical protein